MSLARIDSARLERATVGARASARLRLNDNLHAMHDPIHRLLNATEPGTYVQPHRHAQPPKIETLCVLRGRGAVLVFRDDGAIDELAVLGPEADCRAVEIPGGTWHTLLALEPGTVWFEVKSGPYAPLGPGELARWAPAPDTQRARDYLARLVAYAQADATRQGRLV